MLIKEEDVKDLIKPMGLALVSNRICIDGEKVRFMYRDVPEENEDSGWKFLAGDEDEEYLADGYKSKFLEVNTVANLDKAIIPYLNQPVGIELVRGEDDEFFLLPEEMKG